MRFLKLVCLSAAMVVAACGSDDGDGAVDDSSEEVADEEAVDVDTTTTTTAPPASTTSTTAQQTTTTEQVELTGSWPGVTEDTIRLGFLEIDLAQLREMGLAELDRGDPEVVINALVDELNERGGILGRRIDAYPEIVLPIDPTAAEAVCIRLVDEVEVFAVVGQFAGPTSEVNPCFTDFGETIMVGGNPTPAQLDAARAPWISAGMSAERRLTAGVQLLHEGGHIGERVGVVWAAEDEDAATELVVPELTELGYEVVMEAAQTSPAGDRLALGDEWAVFMERLDVAGADTVVLVESGAGVNGANQLVLGGWDGQILIVDSVSALGSIGASGEAPLEDLERVLGTMAASAQETFELAASQECVEILEAADPEITVYPSDQVPEGEPDWAQALLPMCARLRLFEMIALAAGPDLTHESFLAAAEGLGELELPQFPFASLGPGKLDASDTLRVGRFDASLGESGGAQPEDPLTRVEG